MQGSAYGGEMFGYGRDTKISDLMEKIKDPDFQQQVSDVAGQISGALDQSKPKPPPPPPGPFALSPFSVPTTSGCTFFSQGEAMVAIFC